MMMKMMMMMMFALAGSSMKLETCNIFGVQGASMAERKKFKISQKWCTATELTQFI